MLEPGKDDQNSSPKSDPTNPQIKYMLRGALPSKLRTVHDFVCFLLLCVLALAFLYAFNLAILQGKPKDLLYPTGQSFICGLDDAVEYPFAYFYNPFANNKTVCVKECPKLDSKTGTVTPISCYFNFKCGYQAQIKPESEYYSDLSKLKVIGYPTKESVGNICVPDRQIMTSSMLNSGLSIYQKLMEQHSWVSPIDIYNHYKLLAISVGFSLLLSIVCHRLARTVSLSKIMIPTTVLAMIILLTNFLIFLFQSGLIQTDITYDLGYLGLSFLQLQSRYIGLSCTFLVLFLLFGAVIIKQFYAVGKTETKTWSYIESLSVSFTWRQFVIYLQFIILMSIHWGMCIFGFLFLSASQPTSQLPNKLFVQALTDLTVQKIFCYYIYFWAIFGSFIIIGLSKTITALYYSEDCASKPVARKNRLFDYWVITLYHHFGSITFANFFVILAAPIQFFVWGLSDLHNPSCMSKLSCITKWFCSGAYIQIAVRGSSYLNSSCQAYELVLTNYEESYKDRKNRIQSERLLVTCMKVICSLLCPMVIHAAYTFVFSLHVQIFQILFIIVPSWFIGYGFSSIILNGIEAKSEIQLINTQIRQKNNETLSNNSQKFAILSQPPLQTRNHEESMNETHHKLASKSSQKI